MGPLRAEVRGTTAACWLPSQESNLPELCLTGSRVHLARLRGMNWWTTGVTLPARVACKASLHPCAWPVVPRVGFEPTSPRLRRGAFTRSAFSAELERPAGNDPASSRWQREALPLSYGRVVCGAGFEPAKDRAVGFTDRFRWPLGYPHALGSREARVERCRSCAVP